jgi:hypothetical protein
VVAVRGVQDGTTEDLAPAAREAERRLLTSIGGEHGFEQVLDDLVARADIELRELAGETP